MSAPFSDRYSKRRTALSLFVLAASLVPACGDDDAAREPRGAPLDAGRDSRSADAPADAPELPDSSLDAPADTAQLDGSAVDAADGSERGDGGMPEGSTQDAASEARAEAGPDAAERLDAAPPDAPSLDANPDAVSDAMALTDSRMPDSGADAGSEPDGAGEPLVFWQVGEDFACEGTPTQVECNDDDFAEAYVITILQSAGSSCAEGPSRVTVYFEYGSPPAAGEYSLEPLTVSGPSEARLEIDVNNGAQTWVAQSGHVTVAWIEGAPSLSFTGVPARFGGADTTLRGRVTCPSDN